MFTNWKIYGREVEYIGNDVFRVGSRTYRLVKGCYLHLRDGAEMLAAKINGSTYYSNVTFVDQQNGKQF